MMKAFGGRHIALALAGAVSLAAALPAAAQSQGSYSEQKLQAYANAHIQVAELVSQYQPKLRSAQEAGDTAKLESLQQEANDKLLGAIKSAPRISVDEYRQITAEAREDQELFSQLKSYVEDLREGGN